MKCPQCGYEHEQANSNEGTALGASAQGQGSGDLFGGMDGTSPDGSVAGKPAPASGKRRTQLSPTWQPTDEQKLYCRQQGKDPDAMAEAFKGYYLAKGTVWKDWNLVWMRACREWNTTAVHYVASPLVQAPDNNLWRKRLTSKFWSPWWGPRVGEPGCQVPKELWP